MNCSDKINIYVPENIGRALENDALLFEVFKRDGKTINKNRFLSMLIKGYYNAYEEEMQKTYVAVIKKIGDAITDTELRSNIATQIVNDIFRPTIPIRKGKNPTKLSLKPTIETKGLINQIMDELGVSDYISQYFCRMLMSYCEKPFSIREQIVFDGNYKFLESACQKGQGVMFTTIWDSRKNHYVYPYKIVVGTEEMFNYLLCCEKDGRTGALVAKSYRLNRIAKIDYSSQIKGIPPNVVENLERMLKYGPQYAINDEVECCVRLTDRGERTYSRIYYGRPIADRIENTKEGHLYYFRCSDDQVFLYFRRFGYNDAEIIAPEALRTKMSDFHLKAYETYRDGKVIK